MNRRTAISCLLLAAASCGPEDPRGRVNQPGPLSEPFAISDFFTPSGYMGDGEKLGLLTGKVNDGCLPRPAGAQGDCYVFTYRPGPYRWAGVYWVYPANNWGSRQGRSVEGAAFRSVRLKAAVSVDRATVNFVVGNIADPLLPNRDRVSATTSVKLGRAYTDVALDIAEQDFDHVIGALAWSMAYPDELGGEGEVHVYLDDLVWDEEPVTDEVTP